MSDEPAAFGIRLRRAREAQGTSLRQIADTTKLSVRTLEALERGKTKALPGGIYRRSVVRAYAREIGLDPETTLREFLAEYPDDLPPPGGPASQAPGTGAAEAERAGRSWRGLMVRVTSAIVPVGMALVRRVLVDR